MSKRSFRFVHTSDLHLERPPSGLDEVPDHLRGVLLDAAYLAAERVFDTAVAEEADFVVLAGDILQPAQAEPRALLFLVSQFERLAKKQIPVYWAASPTDQPARWTENLPLPTNVELFPYQQVGAVVHRRAGEPLVELLGRSAVQRRRIRTADFVPAGGSFVVAVAHGTLDVESPPAAGVHFWALGGEHRRRTLCTSPAVVHYSGTPQGRRPREAGPHGATLVEVDETGRVRTRFVATDAMRFRDESLVDDLSAGRRELELALDARARALAAEAAGRDLLVNWSIQTSGHLAGELRRGVLGAELLTRLRTTHGQTRPAVWSVALQCAADDALPAEWYTEETLRGEFLRAIRHFEADKALPDWSTYLADDHRSGDVADAVQVDDPGARVQLLREAARLGADLLSGEEMRP